MVYHAPQSQRQDCDWSRRSRDHSRRQIYRTDIRDRRHHHKRMDACSVSAGLLGLLNLGCFVYPTLILTLAQDVGFLDL